MNEEHEKGIEELLKKARSTEMTQAQREEQRRSFAYGNAQIENERVTRAVIDQAAEALEKDKGTASD